MSKNVLNGSTVSIASINMEKSAQPLNWSTLSLKLLLKNSNYLSNFQNFMHCLLTLNLRAPASLVYPIKVVTCETNLKSPEIPPKELKEKLDAPRPLVLNITSQTHKQFHQLREIASKLTILLRSKNFLIKNVSESNRKLETKKML